MRSALKGGFLKDDGEWAYYGVDLDLAAPAQMVVREPVNRPCRTFLSPSVIPRVAGWTWRLSRSTSSAPFLHDPPLCDTWRTVSHDMQEV